MLITFLNATLRSFTSYCPSKGKKRHQTNDFHSCCWLDIPLMSLLWYNHAAFLETNRRNLHKSSIATNQIMFIVDVQLAKAFCFFLSKDNNLNFTLHIVYISLWRQREKRNVTINDEINQHQSQDSSKDLEPGLEPGLQLRLFWSFCKQKNK